VGGGLGQQIQPLRDQLQLFKDHPGQVAARMGKAGDVAFCQRVLIDCPEHDRGGPRRRSRDCGLQYGILAAGHDYIDAAASKLAHRRRQAIQIIVLDEINRQVAAFDIAQLAQPILKGGVVGRRAWEPGNDADMEDAGRHLVRIRGRSGKADQKSHAKQPARSFDDLVGASPRYRSPCPRSSLGVLDGSPVWRSLTARRLLSHVIPARYRTRTSPSYRRHRSVCCTPRWWRAAEVPLP